MTNGTKDHTEGPVWRFKKALSVVSEMYGIPEDVLRSRNRKRSTVDARNMAIRLTKESTNLCLTDIGTLFNRDHSTIIHSIKVTENLIETCQRYRSDYEYAKKCYKQIVYPSLYDEEEGEKESDA